MSEEQCIINMLCSLPKKILIDRIKGRKDRIPDWLNSIDLLYVQKAIEHYDDKKFIAMRKREEELF